MTTDLVLVADIGGTNARFALADIAGEAVCVRDVRKFRAENFETIRDAADVYLKSVSPNPKAACFAVAAPVTGAVIELTNSPWVLDIERMKTALGLDRCLAVNDFEALARSVRYLRKSDLLAIKSGCGDFSAPILVMGSGTGMGQALIVPFNERDRIVSTEGGHAAFAPGTDEERDVMKFIARTHPRVSIERVLSGPGLVNIHRALCALAGAPLALRQAEEITHAALTRECPIAVRTVGMFCGVLGATAGDAVLATGARGGVIFGGGILPRIKDILLNSAFVGRFLDKGRMRSYVEDAPVDLIVRDGAALLGAAAQLREMQCAT